MSLCDDDNNNNNKRKQDDEDLKAEEEEEERSQKRLCKAKQERKELTEAYRELFALMLEADPELAGNDNHEKDNNSIVVDSADLPSRTKLNNKGADIIENLSDESEALKQEIDYIKKKIKEQEENQNQSQNNNELSNQRMENRSLDVASLHQQQQPPTINSGQTLDPSSTTLNTGGTLGVHQHGGESRIEPPDIQVPVMMMNSPIRNNSTYNTTGQVQQAQNIELLNQFMSNGTLDVASLQQHLLAINSGQSLHPSHTTLNIGDVLSAPQNGQDSSRVETRDIQVPLVMVNNSPLRNNGTCNITGQVQQSQNIELLHQFMQNGTLDVASLQQQLLAMNSDQTSLHNSCMPLMNTTTAGGLLGATQQQYGQERQHGVGTPSHDVLQQPASVMMMMMNSNSSSPPRNGSSSTYNNTTVQAQQLDQNQQMDLLGLLLLFLICQSSNSATSSNS